MWARVHSRVSHGAPRQKSHNSVRCATTCNTNKHHCVPSWFTDNSIDCHCLIFCVQVLLPTVAVLCIACVHCPSSAFRDLSLFLVIYQGQPRSKIVQRFRILVFHFVIERWIRNTTFSTYSQVISRILQNTSIPKSVHGHLQVSTITTLKTY